MTSLWFSFHFRAEFFVQLRVGGQSLKYQQPHWRRSTGGYMYWIRPPSCSGWTCLFTFEPIRTKADIFLFPKQLSEPKSVEFTQRNEGAKSREKQRIWHVTLVGWQLPNPFILAWICSLISLREFDRFQFWQLFWTQENKSFWFIKFECQ